MITQEEFDASLKKLEDMLARCKGKNPIDLARWSMDNVVDLLGVLIAINSFSVKHVDFWAPKEMKVPS